MRNSLIHLSLSAIAYAMPALGAQGSDRCDSVLVAQISMESTTKAERSAWLLLIDESNYEAARAGGALNVIIEDLPIGASYQQFSEKRSAYFRRESLNMSRDEARSSFRSTLTRDQVQKWSECMNRDIPGVTILLSDEDASGATATIRYVEAAGRKKKFVLQLTGGTDEKGKEQQKFSLKHTGTHVVTLRRKDKDTKLRITVDGDGMADSAVSSPPVAAIINHDGRCLDPVLLSGDKPATANVAASNANQLTSTAANKPMVWNSGRSTPPSVDITVDLQAPHRIDRIVLVPEQTPDGYTEHSITGQTPSGAVVQLATSRVNTISGGPITLVAEKGSLGRDISKVVISTGYSPSWVAWRDIKIFGCD